MEKTPERPWYKKKRYILGAGGLVAIWLIAGSGSSNVTPTPTPDPIVESATVAQPATTEQPTILAPQTDTTDTTLDATTDQTGENNVLSNDNTYQNVDNETVHSPAYSENNEVPDGASAECRDGTYSFSAHRSGTCSHHGGVEEWE